MKAKQITYGSHIFDLLALSSSRGSGSYIKMKGRYISPQRFLLSSIPRMM